ncbi:MAG: hypothetical protein WA977_01020, partial [Halobacteriota archaeon]
MNGLNNDENALEKINTIPIPTFLVKDNLITFKQPINAEVEFENEQYIFSEDTVKLLVVAKTIEEGITGIKEELAHIWADYILANERELNGDAIKFKKYTLYPTFRTLIFQKPLFSDFRKAMNRSNKIHHAFSFVCAYYLLL